MVVMIVDDSASIRGLLRGMLFSSVDSFCECSDGSEALEMYRKYHPDWVLMDIRMKRMDGFQATETILSSFPEAKIILITQYNEPKLLQKARRSGACACILKDNLMDIERILRASSGSGTGS